MQKDDFKIRYFPDLTSFQSDATSRNLKVCIATEEIVGPVRNGGIASTYYHLARMLADDGHHVTVLFLKGNRCENETIEHWVKWYSKLGIKFVALPFESISQYGFAPFWQRRYYAFYRWLSEQEEPFDIVHTSEWRGGAFYTLGAKRLGLEFQDTLFLVKSSSPHIWNRHYQMRTIENDSMLACSFAEQKTIEWADIVIGGSAHLLSFMERVGYRLPEGRMYVQPNVVDLQDLEIEETRPDYEYGDKVKSDELVFFGRLEARKGLEIFCDALDQLADSDGLKPQKVYFLGKQGQNMPSYPYTPNIEYIKLKAANWPFKVEILPDYDQRAAISFLCAKPRIAVMPSLIENSTMTVYEALVHKIPFLATNVGGTAELIAPEFHEETLTEPHPGKLSKDLQHILDTGGTVAKASFDYKENLKTWRHFHAWLSQRLALVPVKKVISELSYDSAALESDPRPVRPIEPCVGKVQNTGNVKLAAVVYHHDAPSGLRMTLSSLLDQDKEGFDEIVVTTDGKVSVAHQASYNRLKNDMPTVVFKEREHQCVAECYNSVLKDISSESIVFFRAGEHLAKSDMAHSIRTSFQHPHVHMITAIYDHIQDPVESDQGNTIVRYRYLPMGGDIAAHLLHDGALGGSCFAVLKQLILDKGGFLPSYHISHVETEFLARCVMDGEELWVLPRVLYESYNTSKNIHYNRESGKYMRIHPFLASMTYSMKRLFLRLGENYGTTTEENFKFKQSKAKIGFRFNVLKTAHQSDMSSIGMGLIFEIETGRFTCIVRKSQVDIDDGKVLVKAGGLLMVNLPLEPLSKDYLMAKWNFNLQPPNKSLSLITFDCATASNHFIRSVTAIWGSDEIVHITSQKHIVVGEVNEVNAKNSLSPKNRPSRGKSKLNSGFMNSIKRRLANLTGK
ncbi:MAG: glycosyltransferase [Desulfobacterales bacterium]|nr:glycosyltransferase [Desulfobacterales bacterium]